MTDCIGELSGSNMETLEQIVTLQYRKFIRFYKLISKHFDALEGIDYQFKDPSSLDVYLHFDTSKLKAVKSKIKEDMEKYGYEGNVCIRKQSILISIFMEEAT
jgi:hypothetical protein